MKEIIVAIDGPSGSGKSTIAKMIAQTFNIMHLNTGSIYRAYAYACKEAGIDMSEQNKVVEFAAAQDVDVEFYNKTQQTKLNGEPVDDFLRDEKVGMIASKISAIAEIRDFVNQKIRIASKKFGLVAEGRDIGSVVLPHANFKFFLDATPEVRAERRFEELREKVPYEEVLADVLQRDRQDSTRKIAPLIKCEDAIYIDSTNLGINEVHELIKRCMEEKL